MPRHRRLNIPVRLIWKKRPSFCRFWMFLSMERSVTPISKANSGMVIPLLDFISFNIFPDVFGLVSGDIFPFSPTLPETLSSTLQIHNWSPGQEHRPFCTHYLSFLFPVPRLQYNQPGKMQRLRVGCKGWRDAFSVTVLTTTHQAVVPHSRKWTTPPQAAGNKTPRD